MRFCNHWHAHEGNSSARLYFYNVTFSTYLRSSTVILGVCGLLGVSLAITQGRLEEVALWLVLLVTTGLLPAPFVLLVPPVCGLGAGLLETGILVFF